MRRVSLVVLGASTVLVAISGCSKKSSKKDDKADRPSNQLSGDQFNQKLDQGSSIFSDLKGLRGQFTGGSALTSLLLAAQTQTSVEIDVNGADCTKKSEETLDSGNLEMSYECTVVRGGIPNKCNVTVELNGFGDEAGRTQACSGSQTTIDGGDDDDGGDPIPGNNEDETQAFLPDAENIDDCSSAFDMFDSLYAESKTKYEGLAALLKNPTAENQQGVRYIKVAAAADEAVAYEMQPEEGAQGVVAKGRLSGGGSGNKVHIASTTEFTIDFGAMMKAAIPAGMPLQEGDDFPPMDPSMEDPMDPSTDPSMNPEMEKMIMAMSGSETADVDLDAKTLEFTIDTKQSMTQGDETTTTRIAGTISVSAGSDKFVTQRLSIVGADGKGMKTDLTAKLVDKDSILIAGAFDGEGAPGKISYLVKRDSSGQCGVAKP